MSEQLLVPSQLEEPFRRELQFYLEQRMVQRLYAKDSSLWSQELINKDPALAKLDWYPCRITSSRFSNLWSRRSLRRTRMVLSTTPCLPPKVCI